MKGQVYLSSKNGKLFLSLGFRECAVLALRLVKHELAGDAAGMYN